MKRYRVIFTARALAQFEELQDYIQDKAGYGIASSYLSRVQAYCESFSTFPRRGTKRDDILPGLRIGTYKRRIAIAFFVEHDAVIISGIFSKGRNIDQLLAKLAKHKEPL